MSEFAKGKLINEANARLITDAPEMYEMIMKLVEGIELVELLNRVQIVRVKPELVKSAKQLLKRIDGEETQE